MEGPNVFGEYVAGGNLAVCCKVYLLVLYTWFSFLPTASGSELYPSTVHVSDFESRSGQLFYVWRMPRFRRLYTCICFVEDAVSVCSILHWRRMDTARLLDTSQPSNGLTA